MPSVHWRAKLTLLYLHMLSSSVDTKIVFEETNYILEVSRSAPTLYKWKTQVINAVDTSTRMYNYIYKQGSH